MNNGKWMDLDWTLELEMDGFRLEFRLEFRLDLDWIQTEIGQDIPVRLVKVTPGQSNTKTRQWKEGGEGEEGKRDLFFYIFSFREIG